MSGTREFDYPEARRLDLTEEILGYQVSDPYRWMEDADSAERADWLAGGVRVVRGAAGRGGPGGIFWPHGSASC